MSETDDREQELRELCQDWQKVLRLQDWDIYTEICRARDMPLDGTEGSNKIDILKKKAVIAILDEIDFPPDVAWPRDMEATLVHELLHLHFDTGEETTPAQHVACEQGIDILSRVLVEMKRRENIRK